MGISFGTCKQLADRAQANADYFGVPFVVLWDTSGNRRIERYDPAQECHNNAMADKYNPREVQQ
jgi:hypothetical protein